MENTRVLIQHVKASGVIAEIELAVGCGKALQGIVIADVSPCDRTVPTIIIIVMDAIGVAV